MSQNAPWIFFAGHFALLMMLWVRWLCELVIMYFLSIFGLKVWQKTVLILTKYQHFWGLDLVFGLAGGGFSG
jgi:hypothetical protein